MRGLSIGLLIVLTGVAHGASAPRTLLIAIDAVPYDVVAQLTDPALGERALFKGFKRPSAVITTFPSDTHVAWAGLLAPLGVHKSHGYQPRYFDNASREVEGGLSLIETPAPWEAFFDWRLEGVLHTAVAYGWPKKFSLSELHQGLEAFVKSDKPLFAMYIVSTDGVAHIRGPGALADFLVELDASLTALRRDHPEMPFYTVMISDHGVATAAARLMRLTPVQTANALGYAADGAMGLKEGNEQQPTHIYGLINRTGVTAAILAQAGGETAATVLEGQYGFYRTLIGDVPDMDAVIAQLGKDPEILRATQKRYPGTAMNIVPVQFVLELTAQHRLTAANVARVEIELPDDRRTFEDSISTGPFATPTQAASSAPFQTAIILLDGRIDFARYDQLDNPEILAVVRKVAIKLTPHENSRYARVRITAVDGRVLECEGQDYVFAPLDAVDWLARDGEKFVSRQNLERFAALAHDLDRVADVRTLMATLASAR